MCKDVIHYRERKLLSGIDVSEKAGKVSNMTNALDVRRLHTAENIEMVSAAVHEVKSASSAELNDMAKNGFQKCFCYLYKQWQSRSFEHHTGESTIWLVPTPILREDTWEWSGASHFSTPSTNHTRGLATRQLFRVPPCRKGNIHLQTSMSSPGFEPSP
ncbi:hypothetical protein TNCV_1720931 [Trichonephila clavipes]|nr:hypothetical protein TNCV_1720931 [Trichonephila clavipes]